MRYDIWVKDTIPGDAWSPMNRGQNLTKARALRELANMVDWQFIVVVAGENPIQRLPRGKEKVNWGVVALKGEGGFVDMY